MSAKQRGNLSGHLLATCQCYQVGMGANQLLSWRSITGPKARPNSLSNPEIRRGGGICPPIPTIDGSEVALWRVKICAILWFASENYIKLYRIIYKILCCADLCQRYPSWASNKVGTPKCQVGWRLKIYHGPVFSLIVFAQKSGWLYQIMHSLIHGLIE